MDDVVVPSLCLLLLHRRKNPKAAKAEATAAAMDSHMPTVSSDRRVALNTKRTMADVAKKADARNARLERLVLIMRTYPVRPIIPLRSRTDVKRCLERSGPGFL